MLYLLKSKVSILTRENEKRFQSFYELLQECQSNYVAQLTLLQTYAQKAVTYYEQLQNTQLEEAKARLEETPVEKELRELKEQTKQLKQQVIQLKDNQYPPINSLFNSADQDIRAAAYKERRESQLRFSQAYKSFFNSPIYNLHSNKDMHLKISFLELMKGTWGHHPRSFKK